MKEFLQMINASDLAKLQPYLNTGKVVNMEIKDYPKRGKDLAKREVMLEYSDGTKLIGDLNLDNFKMIALAGLTSLSKNFARGKQYGQSSWRGNFSGLFLKSLLQHYNPKHVIDPMVGGGTTLDVCKELGIPNDCFDLNPKYGGFDALNDELPVSSDFIIWHPPYMAFSGSKMPKYSGVEWGDNPHPSDGSHITDPNEFTKWLNKISASLYTALRKGGRMAILMGDSRCKGQFYSMFKEMDIYGTLEQVIIKEQFNCFSDNIQYAGKFIPIMHEYCVVIRKTDNFVIPCHIVKNVAIDIRKSEKITWKALITATMEDFGGKATKDALYDALVKHPKAKDNNHLTEKIRQVLNSFPDFIKLDDKSYALRPFNMAQRGMGIA
jgi:hypothetical protein